MSMDWHEVDRFFDWALELAEALGLESAHEQVVFGGWQYGMLQAHHYFDGRDSNGSRQPAEEWIRDGITGVCNCNLHLDPITKTAFERWALAGFRLQFSRLLTGTIGARS